MGAELAQEATGRTGTFSGVDVGALLAVLGYEPYDDEGVTKLRNCPFGELARAHRDLVCRANLGLVEGLLEGLHVSDVRPALDPHPGHCCVTLA
jgi:predicted ArsR family transcriptional regulator